MEVKTNSGDGDRDLEIREMGEGLVLRIMPKFLGLRAMFPFYLRIIVES